MARKTLLLLILLLLPGLIVPTPAQAAKDYAAERYDVQIDVQEDGSLWVTETIVFRFSGDPFTYVFRTLPTDRTDGITDIRASMDGMPLEQGNQPGQFEIENGDEIEVTWRFQPLTGSTHTFTLQYRVAGVIQKGENADLLEWEIFPNRHEYTIREGMVIINYPAAATLVEQPAVRGPKVTLQPGENQLSFRVENLGDDDTAVVRMAFAPGSLISAPPHWQARQIRLREKSIEALPYALFTLLAALTLGGFALLWTWNRSQRETSLPAAEVRPVQPPRDRRPAIAGILADMGRRIAWDHTHGTLLDLAQQGVLAFVEDGEKKWYQATNFHIELLKEPSGLHPHERRLVEIFFHGKKGPRSQVNINELSGLVSGQWRSLTAALQQELEMLGLVSPERRHRRDSALAIGTTLTVGGLLAILPPVVMASTIANSGSDLWFRVLMVVGALSAASFLLGMTTLITWSSYSPLTDQGEQEAAQWRGFKRYLRDILDGRESLSHLGVFETYLPYTAAFGLAEDWVRYHKKHGGGVVPSWFRPLSAASGPESMSSLVAIIAASSASGSGATGAGAGGAAGGGASGAG